MHTPSCAVTCVASDVGEALLTLNAGSSSIKFAVFEAGSAMRTLVKGQVEGLQTAPHFIAKSGDGIQLTQAYWETNSGESGHATAFEHIWRWLVEYLEDVKVTAVGHRVAHGGADYRAPVLVNAQVMKDLTRLIPLVPLHQPHNIAAIHAVARARPELPQVVCFDTSFHQDKPEVANRLGLPAWLHDEGVRRYGFHGISYAYIAHRLKEIDPNLAAGRVVVAHLGSGSSMCAMRDGRSVETTMGFSSLDGVPMGTRCGTLDPGVLLYLMREHGMGLEDLERLLYKESGLLGISGISNDMRDLLDNDTPAACDAIDYFIYQVNQHLGKLVATLGGLDALVFTAGVGENSAEIRERICRDAVWLGIQLDQKANNTGEGRISTSQSTASVWVIPTDEERMIASYTREVLERDLAAA